MRSQYGATDLSKVKIHNAYHRASRTFDAAFREPTDAIASVKQVHADELPLVQLQVAEAAKLIRRCVTAGYRIVWFLSGLVVKNYLTPYIMDLMRRDFVDHLACNGSVMIHEWELHTKRATSEFVQDTIVTGEFGNWHSIASIHDVVNDLDLYHGTGLGERVGHAMAHNDCALLPVAFTRRCPVTVHLLFGGDVIFQHPRCNPAILGEATHRDFRILIHTIQQAASGVLFINVASQVTAPEVFLKAVSVARNISAQSGAVLPEHIASIVLDHGLHEPVHRQRMPNVDHPDYYDRVCKTLIHRLPNRGESCYLGGNPSLTLPLLWEALL